MKAFFKNLLFFLFFFIPVYILCVIGYGLLMPKLFKQNLNYKLRSYGFTFTRLQEVKKTNNVDVLILGSSHAYRGYDTSFFQKNGYKVMNLGTSAQTPLQTKVLVERYIDQLNPKLVIYDVFPNLFTSDGLESGLDIISNEKNHLDTFLMSLQMNHIKGYNLFVYSTFNDLANRKEGVLEMNPKDGDLYIEGGYVEKDLRFFNVSKYKTGDKYINWNSKQLNAFESILKKIKSKKRSLILIQAPVSSIFYKSQKDNVKFDNKMKSYHDNYYNFNDNYALNDSLHFYDSNHLNKKGVVEFNQKVLSLIKTRIEK